MCTVSWSCREAGFSLFFNRDEQTTRPRAEFPYERMIEGVRVLLPKDPLGGGTWIVANEYGLVVSLLNNYEKTIVVPFELPRTRGEIPLTLAACNTAKKVWSRLANSNLECYLPFHICCLDRFGDVLIASWNGSTLEQKACDLEILTTSSFKSREVQSYREKLFRDRRPVDSEEMFLYHTDRSHSDLAFNPLMDRKDAFTQSISAIECGNGEIAFTYYDRIDDCSSLDETSRKSLKLKGFNQ